MALKLNIRPEIEKDMENLIHKTHVRSKTEYINRALEEYNRQIRRRIELSKLTGYFGAYREEAKNILDEFAELKSDPD